VARARRGSPVLESFRPLGARVNTATTPPLVEVEFSRGPVSTLGVLAKGGGSEMASRRCFPGAGWSGALEFIAGTVEEAGARACPRWCWAWASAGA
jgi:tartrate dehydratase alpha subunit/fumarate hydratase class I-like protein